MSRLPEQTFDVIISRGGTAELIRSLTPLPVVDIPLSVYDIFRSIKLAENYTSKYALIGFPNITRNAHFLCDMMQYNIDIYTIHNEQEAESRLKKLQQEGCNMILCDMITNSLAQKYGLTSILIASGTESIESAFDQAIQVVQSHHQLQTELSFSHMILEKHPWPVVVFDENEKIVFFTKLLAIISKFNALFSLILLIHRNTYKALLLQFQEDLLYILMRATHDFR